MKPSKRFIKRRPTTERKLGIRMDDSILTRGLYQGDVLYADDEKIIAVNTPPCEVIARFPYSGSRKAGGKGLLRDRQPPCTAVLGRKTILLSRFTMSRCLLMLQKLHGVTAEKEREKARF